MKNTRRVCYFLLPIQNLNDTVIFLNHYVPHNQIGPMKIWFFVVSIPQHELTIEESFKLLEFILIDISFEVKVFFEVCFEYEIVLFAQSGSV